MIHDEEPTPTRAEAERAIRGGEEEPKFKHETILTWLSVALFFVLCCLFPHQAAWLFSVFRRN
jgi:hypothetical protein